MLGAFEPISGIGRVGVIYGTTPIATTFSIDSINSSIFSPKPVNKYVST